MSEHIKIELDAQGDGKWCVSVTEYKDGEIESTECVDLAFDEAINYAAETLSVFKQLAQYGREYPDDPCFDDLIDVEDLEDVGSEAEEDRYMGDVMTLDDISNPNSYCNDDSRWD